VRSVAPGRRHGVSHAKIIKVNKNKNKNTNKNTNKNKNI
jgi:hypothetical protein